MAKGLTIKDALKIFEEKKGVVATEAEKVALGHLPAWLEVMWHLAQQL